MPLRKIVSGGQTGADRAALDAARACGVPLGGWVPRGRAAEDGPIPPEYAELQEADSPDVDVRTRLNVRDSDGTLIVSHGKLAGGSALTLEFAKELRKPVLHLDLETLSAKEALEVCLAWLHSNDIETLNVAGPRASSDARVYSATFAIVSGLLAARGLHVE